MSLERQVRNKLAAKRDPEQDKEAQAWIETILGAKFPPGEAYEDVIRDGTVLCQLINKLAPGSVPKINTSGGQFKMMENINNFQAAIKAYGVADIDVFQTVDLWEKKDIAGITNTLFALGRQTYKHPEWKGPNLGNKPADENKREFSEETLRAGESIIGLQAGQNKGATQAGQSMGAGRKIILGKYCYFPCDKEISTGIFLKKLAQLKIKNKTAIIRKTLCYRSENACNEKKEKSVIRRRRIGHFRLTHGYLMSSENPPTYEFYNGKLTIEHIPPYRSSSPASS